ncbi:hypothetical protein EHQ76_07345 [Leptospira barantonii]|uniref:Uncharacterized protein n=1 Tax=Leptospira barantonii TaxID=2023184 RepID=A0A5F2BL20_9LEPT|nr:hypothetical protein EHQ76_07345 [Leptospira barantonii]
MPSFLGPFSNDEVLSNNKMKNLKCSRIELDFTSPLGTYNLVENLPVNSLVFQTLVKVEFPFDGNSTLTIGNSQNPNCYLDETGIDLKSAGTYVGEIYDLIVSSLHGRAYWNPGTSTQGRLCIFFVYSD